MNEALKQRFEEAVYALQKETKQYLSTSDVIKLMHQAYAEAEQDKWVRVEDCKPENEQEVNILLESGKVSISTFRKDDYGRNGFYCGNNYSLSWSTVIKWQPLPKSPISK